MKILLLILALPVAVFAQLDDPAWLATATKPAAAAGGAWTYSLPEGDIDSTDGAINPIVKEAYPITLSAGTATKIRLYIRSVTGGGSNLKIALYNGRTAATKLAEGSVSVTEVGYAEVTIANTAVSSAEYYIAFTAETATSLAIGFKNNGLPVYYEVSGAYTLNDPGTFGSSIPNITPSVGVFIQ